MRLLGQRKKTITHSTASSTGHQHLHCFPLSLSPWATQRGPDRCCTSSGFALKLRNIELGACDAFIASNKQACPSFWGSAYLISQGCLLRIQPWRMAQLKSSYVLIFLTYPARHVRAWENHGGLSPKNNVIKLHPSVTNHMVPKDVSCLLSFSKKDILKKKKIHLFFLLYHHSKNSKMFVLGGILESKWLWNFRKLLQMTQNFFNEWRGSSYNVRNNRRIQN